MKALLPLKQSHEHDAFEGQLKQLAMALYESYLAAAAQNINVYGTPYLGNRDLLQKNLVADGIGNFEAENVDSSILKYLHMARRYRNGKRGLHLLNTYLRCLWSEKYKAYQLYFVKNGIYAEDSSLFSLDDIAELQQDVRDFILTSRVRVELDPTITPAAAIPSDVANSLDDTLPARLFIHDIVVRRDVHDEVKLGQHSDFFSVTKETVIKFEIEKAVYLSSKPYPAESFESLQTNIGIQSFEFKNVLVEFETPSEAVLAANANIESMQLKNILNVAEIQPEAVLAANANIESMQLKNILNVAEIEPEAVLAANANIESMQISKVRLGMDTSIENLTINVSIDGFSIDG